MRSSRRRTSAEIHSAIHSSGAVFPICTFSSTEIAAEEAGTMKENRTEVRFEICLTARWQGSAVNHNVRISDLSEGGCYVDTILEVNVGETLFLEVLMPDGEWFELRGVVAHHTLRLGFGVRFVNVDEKQQRQIHSLLRIQNPIPTESAKTSESRKTLIPWKEIELTSRM
jgi:hypothetical protein